MEHMKNAIQALDKWQNENAKLILSEREREWRSKAQERVRARAHPKSTERERKLALIFALKI